MVNFLCAEQRRQRTRTFRNRSIARKRSRESLLVGVPGLESSWTEADLGGANMQFTFVAEVFL
jgi:hypothetical protein